MRGNETTRQAIQLVTRPANGLKDTSATAKKLLEGSDLAPHGPPVMHRAMRAMMRLHRREERRRIITAADGRGVTLIFMECVALAPGVTRARIDGRVLQQKMGARSRDEQKLVGRRG
jgi:hypothetical protein